MATTTWKQVVYDVADAYREASETTSKVPVGELPDIIRSGSWEDLEPEVSEQESIIDEIQEALALKGMLVDYGQFVWRRTITVNGVATTDYIVAGNEEAYPDKAEQDGYYYEKVNDCTGIYEEILVTPTADATSITVAHSLGVVPTQVLLITETFPGTTYSTSMIIDNLPYNSTTFRGATYYRGTSTTSSAAALGTSYLPTKTATEVTLTTHSTSYKFRSGVTYKVRLFV